MSHGGWFLGHGAGETGDCEFGVASSAASCLFVFFLGYHVLFSRVVDAFSFMRFVPACDTVARFDKNIAGALNASCTRRERFFLS